MKNSIKACCKTTVKLLKNTLPAVCQLFAKQVFGAEIIFAMLKIRVPDYKWRVQHSH